MSCIKSKTAMNLFNTVLSNVNRGMIFHQWAIKGAAAILYAIISSTIKDKLNDFYLICISYAVIYKPC